MNRGVDGITGGGRVTRHATAARSTRSESGGNNDNDNDNDGGDNNNNNDTTNEPPWLGDPGSDIEAQYGRLLSTLSVYSQTMSNLNKEVSMWKARFDAAVQLMRDGFEMLPRRSKVLRRNVLGLFNDIGAPFWETSRHIRRDEARFQMLRREISKVAMRDRSNMAWAKKEIGKLRADMHTVVAENNRLRKDVSNLIQTGGVDTKKVVELQRRYESTLSHADKIQAVEMEIRYRDACAMRADLDAKILGLEHRIRESGIDPSLDRLPESFEAGAFDLGEGGGGGGGQEEDNGQANSSLKRKRMGRQHKRLGMTSRGCGGGRVGRRAIRASFETAMGVNEVLRAEIRLGQQSKRQRRGSGRCLGGRTSAAREKQNGSGDRAVGRGVEEVTTTTMHGEGFGGHQHTRRPLEEEEEVGCVATMMADDDNNNNNSNDDDDDDEIDFTTGPRRGGNWGRGNDPFSMGNTSSFLGGGGAMIGGGVVSDHNLSGSDDGECFFAPPPLQGGFRGGLLGTAGIPTYVSVDRLPVIAGLEIRQAVRAAGVVEGGIVFGEGAALVAAIPYHPSRTPPIPHVASGYAAAVLSVAPVLLLDASATTTTATTLIQPPQATTTTTTTAEATMVQVRNAPAVPRGVAVRRI